ncbi:MAG: AAA family ATPase [Candidatus Riflebacteria bacterium]|nr:AAA family ATPase [Candidatus Riflebacteria bacterium]
MEKLPYGIASFEKLRSDGYLYVDRTQYIEKIENLNEQYLLFVRPRRFGKSLFIDTMASYYDIAMKDKFEKLFKGLYIHQNPTPCRNSYLVLKLDFSGIDVSQGIEIIQKNFFESVRGRIRDFISRYKHLIDFDSETIKLVSEADFVEPLLGTILTKLSEAGFKLYLFIDEYDNFSNELWSTRRERDYQSLITGDGYIKSFFKNLKIYAGKDGGVIDRIFITGVSPLVVDDLTSGANILSNISLESDFNELPGFTEDEVKKMLASVIEATNTDKPQDEILSDIKKYYNGYIFSPDASKKIYNPSMTLFFLNQFQKKGDYPREMLDRNMQTDFNKLDYISKIGNEPQKMFDYVMEILKENQILCQIEDRFRLPDLIKINSLFSLMYYLGILTICDSSSGLTKLTIPNYVVRKLYWEYIRGKFEEFIGSSLNHYELLKTFELMHSKGEIKDFTEYTFKNVVKAMSNRDFAPVDEHSFKFYMLALFSLDAAYFIYTESEMQRGYSDIVLRRAANMAGIIKYNWLIEVKYLGKKATESQIEKKITEAKEQIKKYRGDERFYDSLTEGASVLRSVILVFVNDTEFRIIDCDNNYATFAHKSSASKSSKSRKPARKLQ